MRTLLHAFAVITLCASSGWTADRAALEEVPFEEQMRNLKAERDQGEKLRRARDIIQAHHLSSLQVKAIAAGLSDDNARLEFAIAAYPRTVDPENFYEVYDAFTTFSKVMRLHDRVHPSQRPTGPPVVIPQTVTDRDFQDAVQALRKESFDQTRIQVARQILSNSRRLFLATQVKQMLACFDFEPSKLEVAKFAYDYTFDREKYFLVNDAFSFENSKRELSGYLQSRTEQPVPGPRR